MPMICPICGSVICKRKTPELLRDDRTGLLIRVRLITCPKCGPGKDVETHQISFYGDSGPLGDPTPFPTTTAA